MKVARVIVKRRQTEAISSNVTADFRTYRSTSLFRVVDEKPVGSCLRPSWEIPFSEVADEKHGRTGQKEPFYPSSQKGISLTTLSHLLKKTWNDVQAETKTGRKKVEKREGDENETQTRGIA